MFPFTKKQKNYRVVLRCNHQPGLVRYGIICGDTQHSSQVIGWSICYPLDSDLILFFNRGMRGRSVPPLVKKIVFGGLAKILFIQLDVAEGCSCTKAKVAMTKDHLNKKTILCRFFILTVFSSRLARLHLSEPLWIDGSSSIGNLFGSGSNCSSFCLWILCRNSSRTINSKWMNASMSTSVTVWRTKATAVYPTGNARMIPYQNDSTFPWLWQVGLIQW